MISFYYSGKKNMARPLINCFGILRNAFQSVSRDEVTESVGWGQIKLSHLFHRTSLSTCRRNVFQVAFQEDWPCNFRRRRHPRLQRLVPTQRPESSPGSGSVRHKQIQDGSHKVGLRQPQATSGSATIVAYSRRPFDDGRSRQ